MDSETAAEAYHPIEDAPKPRPEGVLVPYSKEAAHLSTNSLPSLGPSGLVPCTSSAGEYWTKNELLHALRILWLSWTPGISASVDRHTTAIQSWPQSGAEGDNHQASTGIQQAPSNSRRRAGEPPLD